MPTSRFAYANLIPSATVTASSTADGFNVANLKNGERALPWRSDTTGTDEEVIIDLGAAQACTFAALADYVTRSSGAVELYEGGSGGSPGAYNLVATFPAMTALNRLGYVFFNSTSARHWKVTWTTAGTDYAEAGVVFLGSYYDIGQAPEWPSFDLADGSHVTASIDGQESYALRPHRTTGSFAFLFLSETQLGQLHTIFSQVGVAEPFFFILDTGTDWMAWYLRFAGPLSKSVSRTGSRTYRVAFSWAEAL